MLSWLWHCGGKSAFRLPFCCQWWRVEAGYFLPGSTQTFICAVITVPVRKIAEMDVMNRLLPVGGGSPQT